MDEVINPPTNHCPPVDFSVVFIRSRSKIASFSCLDPTTGPNVVIPSLQRDQLLRTQHHHWPARHSLVHSHSLTSFALCGFIIRFGSHRLPPATVSLPCLLPRRKIIRGLLVYSLSSFFSSTIRVHGGEKTVLGTRGGDHTLVTESYWRLD